MMSRATRCLLVFCWFALLATGAHADAPQATAPVAPQLTAVRVEQPPRIDGRLDDACWSAATHVAGFARMENGAAEYEPTEAWICYDRDCVYVAWYCHDSRPDTIVAQQRKRGGSLRGDDWVGIDIDQDFDGRGAYWFDVSAGGVQVESIPGGSASKIEWRGDWQAATARVDDGWQAEIAVPLSIFRYPRGQSTFGFVLIRRLAREDDWSTWPNVGPEFELTRQAAWGGLDLPAPRQGPVLMPYTLAEVGDTEHRGGDAGVDLKQHFANGLEGLVSYNPDFRDIEDVVETIDFTYTERYLPEYRPFFLEGGGYHPGTRLFYSRRIADFTAGAKLFGQTGPYGSGAMFTTGAGGEWSMALNESYHLTPYSDVGASLVQYRPAEGGPRNLAYSFGTGQRFPKPDGEGSYWANWQFADAEGGGRAGAASAGWYRDRQNGLSWGCGWDRVGAGFAPALGYVPETDVEGLWLDLGDRHRYDSGAVLDRYWGAHLSRGWAQTGERWNASFDGSANRRDQRSLSASLGAGSWDGFPEWTAAAGLGWGTRDLYRAGGVGLTIGERLEHPYRYLSFSQGRQFNDRLSAQLRAEHVFASELDDAGLPTPPEWQQQYVLTTTYDITWERSVSARLVAGEGGTNAYLAFRQKTRLGTDAWLIIGDPNADSFTPRLAVKLVRVL
jgi:hypothetical protein